MKIGIAFDLRQEYLDEGYDSEQTAEFDKPETIEAIETALQEFGHDTRRIGSAKSMIGALAAGERWDLVFNIAEGLHGLGRESLVPCLCEEYRIPYTFSDPLTNAVCLHKGVCKRVARDLGVPTADFAVIEKTEEVDKIDMPFPLFAKPVAEGTGKGISDSSKIGGKDDLRQVCDDLIRRFDQPVLVERYLPGREFTVGITGTGRDARTVEIMEVLFKKSDEIYSYFNKENFETEVVYKLLQRSELFESIAKVALSAWRGLNCRDGGRLDIRLDENDRPMFMEVNPLAGLNPKVSDLPIMCRLAGKPYKDLIGAIIASAMKRV